MRSDPLLALSMSLGEVLDDEYVINLLKRDAEASRNRGLGSLMSNTTAGKRRGDAPKPNTRFLQQIIRETDSHNAALKAREEADAKARLRDLRREQKLGKRRRDQDGGVNDGVKRRRGGEREGRWASVLGGLGSRQGQPAKRDERGVTATDDQSSPKRERRPRHEDKETASRHKHCSETDPLSPEHRTKHRRRGERSGSPKPRHRTSDHSSKRANLPSPRTFRKDSARTREISPSASDSDPLNDIVGPAPAPTVLPRGRGARNASTIDTRFRANYDPQTDVSLDHEDDSTQDDWAMALEAVRDRAKWRSQGADRLRAAGFTEEEVGKWEKCGTEKDVEDVRWRKRGEGREWDRGKVVDEDGDVEVKAEWGRLKDT